MISGLVAYLGADEGLASAAVLAMDQHSTMELGPRDGRRQPLVLETQTAAESQQLTDWLSELPGVEHVDVVFVHLDEEPPAAESPEQETYTSSLRTTRN